MFSQQHQLDRNHRKTTTRIAIATITNSSKKTSIIIQQPATNLSSENTRDYTWVCPIILYSFPQVPPVASLLALANWTVGWCSSWYHHGHRVPLTVATRFWHLVQRVKAPWGSWKNHGGIHRCCWGVRLSHWHPTKMVGLLRWLVTWMIWGYHGFKNPPVLWGESTTVVCNPLDVSPIGGTFKTLII